MPKLESPRRPKTLEAHVLWEGKSCCYGNTANVYRFVAVQREADPDDVVVDSSGNLGPAEHDVSFYMEKRSTDALGSPIWIGDGYIEGPMSAMTVYFAMRGPDTVPDWLRVWYNRQRDLPLTPLR